MGSPFFAASSQTGSLPALLVDGKGVIERSETAFPPLPKNRHFDRSTRRSHRLVRSEEIRFYPYPFQHRAAHLHLPSS
jgi:hypothetical protein